MFSFKIGVGYGLYISGSILWFVCYWEFLEDVVLVLVMGFLWCFRVIFRFYFGLVKIRK